MNSSREINYEIWTIWGNGNNEAFSQAPRTAQAAADLVRELNEGVIRTGKSESAYAPRYVVVKTTVVRKVVT